MSLNKTPSELDRELSIDDYMFFVANAEVEPLPSQKIDYAITMIRAQVAATTAQKIVDPEKFRAPWELKYNFEEHVSKKQRAMKNLVKYGPQMSPEDFDKAKKKIEAMED